MLSFLSRFFPCLKKQEEAKLWDSTELGNYFQCSDLEIDHVLETMAYQEDIGGYWVYDGEKSRYFAAYVPTKNKGCKHSDSLRIKAYGKKNDEVSFTPLWRNSILEVLKEYI